MVQEEEDEMAQPSRVVQVIEIGHSLAIDDNAQSKI
jgi:hypothetical protein